MQNKDCKMTLHYAQTAALTDRYRMPGQETKGTTDRIECGVMDIRVYYDVSCWVAYRLTNHL